jgi:putative ubiquitin-RnfH superfamily antitoxin RatB of RatAB toxin-antitoxin module
MGNSGETRITVEVVYATPGRQTLIEIEVAAGATVGEAITLSGIRAAHPEIELAGASVGIFGRLAPLDAVLREGDRVEIYRPLHAGPREARRRRVEGRRRAGKK